MASVELAFHDTMGTYRARSGEGETIAEALMRAVDAFDRIELDEITEVTVLQAMVDGVSLAPEALREEIRTLPDLDDTAAVIDLVGRYRRALNIERDAVAMVTEARVLAAREAREKRAAHFQRGLARIPERPGDRSGS